MRVSAVKRDRTTEPRRDDGITARPQTTALQRRLRRRRRRYRGAAGALLYLLAYVLVSGVGFGNVFKMRPLPVPVLLPAIVVKPQQIKVQQSYLVVVICSWTMKFRAIHMLG